jgi:hypothetical protein
MTRVERAEIAAEATLLLPLFPLAALMSMFYPVIVALFTFVFGRAIIFKPQERWWHADNNMCLPAVYAIFLGTGVITLGLGVAVPLLFSGQPLLPVILACCVYLWWDVRGDKKYFAKKERDDARMIRSEIQLASSAVINALESQINTTQKFTLKGATEPELRHFCSFHGVKKLDTEIAVAYYVKGMSPKDIWREFNLTKEYDATKKRVSRLRVKLEKLL